MSQPAKRVLFVCVENSNRSQMAEAFARLYGSDRVQAFSAGSKPSGKVNPAAVEAMRELGCDLTKHQSKSLSEIPPGEFDAVVSMGCGDSCPQVPAKLRQDWDIPDPKSLPADEFNAVRDLIAGKVKVLIDSL